MSEFMTLCFVDGTNLQWQNVKDLRSEFFIGFIVEKCIYMQQVRVFLLSYKSNSKNQNRVAKNFRHGKRFPSLIGRLQSFSYGRHDFQRICLYHSRHHDVVQDGVGQLQTCAHELVVACVGSSDLDMVAMREE